MSDTETTETTTVVDATETTTLGSGGIAGVPTVKTLEALVEIIQSQRSTLSTSNQKNADVFNQIQNFITEKSNGVTQLDGTISVLSGFITEETPEDDEHVVKLNQLTTERNKIVEQLQNADTQRRNVFNSITMTEGALQILTQVLSSAGLTEETVDTIDDTAVVDEEGVITEAE